MTSVQNVVEQLGAFQHIERERGVLQLQQLAKSEGFNEQWGELQEKLRAMQLADRWQEHLGALLAAQVLLPVVKDEGYAASVESFAVGQISAVEVRVRNAVAEVLGCLAAQHGSGVWQRCGQAVVRSIRENYERQDGASGEPNSADDRDLPGSPALGAGNGVAPPPSDVMGALLSAAYTPAAPGQGACRHTTEGWKALETSVRCVHRIAAGSGPAFAEHFTPVLRELLYKCLSHMNRFVRESAYLSLAACFQALRNTDALEGMAVEVATRLKDGLSDNWSQVRYAASRGARELVLGVSAARDSVLAVLLPAMCLNRYYVAEGVRVYSQETWCLVMGTDGRAQVARHVDAVVPYYISQSKANNHAVREAACACMAELCKKVDAAAVEQHVVPMLHALLACFKDESWPCRDAASTASANAVAAYPAAAEPLLPELFRLWFEHLWDNIPSVRENAAVALSHVSTSLGDSAVTQCKDWLQQNLLSAANQEPDSDRFGQLDNTTRFGVAGVKRSAEDEIARHTDQVMFSCGSLAPKQRGGCMDHGFSRPKEPWEGSDGGVYLMRELASMCPDVVLERLPDLAKLASMHHFEHAPKLRETLWNCLPVLAQQLGKAAFKPSLELFLEPMFKDLRCDNQLCECAAGKCIAAFRDWMGPAVFAGRLEEWQKEEMATSGNVPAQLVWDSATPPAPKAPAAPKSGSLAEQMRKLPPGAPIPNLLAR